MKYGALAIVIPAYRAQFLEAALQSVLAQTDQRFTLYVFNDASPEPVAEVVEKFQSRRPLTYHRFADNLGGRSLTQHWDRCIELTTEPWVWLFSDDDMMEPTCVEAFWRELESTQGSFDLYRFNTRCINEQSQVMAVNETYPSEESGRDFLLVRLRGQRGSTAQELIFSRQGWKNVGGFPDYPLAWAADDGFIATMGKHKPIRHIPGPRVLWRLSESNITGKTSTATLTRKFQASRMFIAWAKQFLDEDITATRRFNEQELNRLTEAWFFRNLYFRRKYIDWNTCWLVDRFATEVWQHPRGYGSIKCLAWNLRSGGGAVWRRVRALWHRPVKSIHIADR